MTTRMMLAATLLAGLAVPVPVRAQDALTITLQGAPAATPVSAVINGAKQVVGQTDAGGKVILNTAAMNIGKGTRVNVRVGSQGGQPEVVLVPQGQTDPDCNDPQRRNDPDCRLVGWFNWGQTAAVTLTLGGAAPVFSTGGAVTAGQPGGVTVGVTGDFNWYHSWTDVVGNQPGITGSTGQKTPFGGGAFVQYSPGFGSRWTVGAGVRYNSQTFGQTFSGSNPLLPTRTSGTVDAWFFDAYGGFVIPMRTVTINLVGGGTFAYDVAEFLSHYGDLAQEERRTHTGFMSRFGAVAEFPVSGPLGFVGGVDYTTGFRGGDADAHARISAGLRWQWGFGY